MSCIKVSIFVLLISIAVGYFYGPKFHSYIPIEVVQKIQSYVPKQVMQWMNESPGKIKIEPQKQESTSTKPRIFTKEDLWENYRGTVGSKGLYLAFLGKVYDVSEGKQYYAPGGGYDFFAGRDGTKGFVTGDFTDAGLIDVLDGVDTSSYIGFDEWIEFYETTYKFVGVVVGNFYDENGEPTDALKAARGEIQNARDDQDRARNEMKKYPPCNSESSKVKGSRVWCSTRSGGIQRDWVGVPRLYHAPGAPEARCACVRTTGSPTEGQDQGKDRGDLDSPKMREYDNCEANSPSCVTIPPA